MTITKAAAIGGGVIGAGLFAVPMIAGLIVVQLVARGRRRRHLIAR